MSKENDDPTFEGLNPPSLFREFASPVPAFSILPSYTFHALMDRQRTLTGDAAFALKNENLI